MNNATDIAISTHGLSVGYDEAIIVPEFDLRVPARQVVSIIGANGCGKSTVLKAIGRVIPRAGGTVIINGEDTATLKSVQIARQMAILPQTPTAPGTLTCRELVGYGRFPYQRGLGRMTAHDREVVDWALKVTSMGDFANREIAFLSGGQRQRVWIAMALAQQTGIILLDEPTTYLDLCHQLEVLELLRKLNEEEGTTIVMVLHDLNLAARYSGQLVAMRDGRIYAAGAPREVFTPAMLADCFGIDGQVDTDARTGKPLCVTYDLMGASHE